MDDEVIIKLNRKGAETLYTLLDGQVVVKGFEAVRLVAEVEKAIRESLEES